MLKKTITYEDWNGLERTEDFWFNLSQAELAEMALSKGGGFEEYIEKIVNAKDIDKLSTLFKEIILKAYGVKSEDGRRFMKSDRITREFTETQAYSDLYMELSTDAEAASAFINGLLPKSLMAKAKEELKNNPELKAKYDEVTGGAGGDVVELPDNRQ